MSETLPLPEGNTETLLMDIITIATDGLAMLDEGREDEVVKEEVIQKIRGVTDP